MVSKIRSRTNQTADEVHQKNVPVYLWNKFLLETRSDRSDHDVDFL